MIKNFLSLVAAAHYFSIAINDPVSLDGLTADAAEGGNL
jgi:hypothetical protein